MFGLKILILLSLPFVAYFLSRRFFPNQTGLFTGITLGMVIFPTMRILTNVYGLYSSLHHFILWGGLCGLCGFLLDRHAGRSRKSLLTGPKEIVPKNEDAYYLVLGAYHGAGKLSEKLTGLLNSEILADLADKILQYAKAVGIEDKLQGDYGKIDKVVAENCPERALQLFQTGQIIIALAFPSNQPSEKQLDMLELGMKNLGVLQASGILKPVRAITQKDSVNPVEIVPIVWNALAETTEALNKNTETAGSSSQPQKEMTMGDLMETSLGKYSHLKPSDEYSKPEPNCSLLGYWSSHFLTVALITTEDPIFITELLSVPAEKMVPYAKKLDVSPDIIMHGYNSITGEIEKKYSPEAASVYRMGFLLGRASAPLAEFRIQKNYDDFLLAVKKVGIPHLKEIDTLDIAIRSGKNESIARAGTEALYALANVLQTIS